MAASCEPLHSMIPPPVIADMAAGKGGEEEFASVRVWMGGQGTHCTARARARRAYHSHNGAGELTVELDKVGIDAEQRRHQRWVCISGREGGQKEDSRRTQLARTVGRFGRCPQASSARACAGGGGTGSHTCARRERQVVRPVLHER